jgi:hypothetical protein
MALTSSYVFNSKRVGFGKFLATQSSKYPLREEIFEQNLKAYIKNSEKKSFGEETMAKFEKKRQAKKKNARNQLNVLVSFLDYFYRV